MPRKGWRDIPKARAFSFKQDKMLESNNRTMHIGNRPSSRANPDPIYLAADAL